jgi:hypothetical protein
MQKSFEEIQGFFFSFIVLITGYTDKKGEE